MQERTLEFRLSQRYTMMMNGILQSIKTLLHKTSKCESQDADSRILRKDEREKNCMKEKKEKEKEKKKKKEKTQTK